MKATSSELKQRHQNTIIMCIHDVYSAATSYRMTHDKLLEWLDRNVYQRREWRLQGQWKQAYCHGVLDECHQRWMAKLVWCFYINGRYTPAQGADKLPDWPGWDKIDGDASRMCWPPDAQHPEYKPIS